MKLQIKKNYDKKIPTVKFFSSNQLKFCSQKRWKLLSASVFKSVKKVIRHINDNLSDKSEEELFFFNKVGCF